MNIKNKLLHKIQNHDGFKKTNKKKTPIKLPEYAMSCSQV